jgi:hypothetical protein
MVLIEYRIAEAMSTIAQRCRELRILRCPNRLCYPNLPPAANCRAHHCDRLTDDGLFALTSHAHRLRELDVSHCSEVTSQGISTLSRCPSLEVLCVNGTSASEDFCLELRSLSSLHLKGLSSLGDATITGTLTAGSSMRYLNVAECGIGDASAHHIREHTPSLTCLCQNSGGTDR